MNANRYITVLEDHLLNMINIHGCTTFMQASTPCHKAKKVMKWLTCENIDVVDWPGNRPDLNPIKNAWNVMKRSNPATNLPYQWYSTSISRIIGLQSSPLNTSRICVKVWSNDCQWSSKAILRSINVLYIVHECAYILFNSLFVYYFN